MGGASILSASRMMRLLKNSMITSRALAASFCLAGAWLCASPAIAQQEIYSTNDDVIVNPVPGSGVLLYPGGKYGRVMRPLLQPGQPYPGATEPPIHLHMPYKHVARKAKPVTPAAPPTAVATAEPAGPTEAPDSPAQAATNIPGFESGLPAQAPVAPPKPAAAAPKPAAAQMPKPVVAQAPKPAMAQAPKPMMAQAPKPSASQGQKPMVAQAPRPMVAQATKPAMPRGFTPVVAQVRKPVAAPATQPTPAPAATSTAAGIPFSLAPERPIQPPAMAPARVANNPPPQAPAPAPMRVASNQPPPAQTPTPDQGMAGLVRQSQILFGPGVADPVPESIDAIKGLASPLNSALAAGATRVQVVAYGGSRGDKSSDARRLSLKRALIIRQLLIDGGVPSGRIDVRAMGGTTDAEPTDRVDIFTKA